MKFPLSKGSRRNSGTTGTSGPAATTTSSKARASPGKVCLPDSLRVAETTVSTAPLLVAAVLVPESLLVTAMHTDSKLCPHTSVIAGQSGISGQSVLQEGKDGHGAVIVMSAKAIVISAKSAVKPLSRVYILLFVQDSVTSHVSFTKNSKYE